MYNSMRVNILLYYINTVTKYVFATIQVVQPVSIKCMKITQTFDLTWEVFVDNESIIDPLSVKKKTTSVDLSGEICIIQMNQTNDISPS